MLSQRGHPGENHTSGYGGDVTKNKVDRSSIFWRQKPIEFFSNGIEIIDNCLNVKDG